MVGNANKSSASAHAHSVTTAAANNKTTDLSNSHNTVCLQGGRSFRGHTVLWPFLINQPERVLLSNKQRCACVCVWGCFRVCVCLREREQTVVTECKQQLLSRSIPARGQTHSDNQINTRLQLLNALQSAQEVWYVCVCMRVCVCVCVGRGAVVRHAPRLLPQQQRDGSEGCHGA